MADQNQKSEDQETFQDDQSGNKGGKASDTEDTGMGAQDEETEPGDLE